jgi:hypothetical protein
MRTSIVAAAIVLSGLSACARIPAVDYKYAPSTGLVSVSVVQSLACSNDGKRVVVSNAQPTITPSYQADVSQPPWDIDIADNRNDTADTNFTLARWDDGRLKSINSVSTGQGETIVKDVVAIGAAVVAVAGTAPGTKGAPILGVCTRLKSLNKDGVASITYAGQYFLDDLRNKSPQPLRPTAGSTDTFAYLNYPDIGPLQVTMAVLTTKVGEGSAQEYDMQPAMPAIKSMNADNGDDYYFLKLQKIRMATLSVLDRHGSPLGAAQVLVPSTDLKEAWELPIPKAKTFGSTTFALSVAESGAVTSVQYVRNTGAPALLNGASAIASAIKPTTTADKLAQLKAEDDLIAENNRHAKCVAQSDQCN